MKKKKSILKEEKNTTFNIDNDFYFYLHTNIYI